MVNEERMIKVAAQLFPDKADIQRAFKDIPLSARTIAQRADMLSSNMMYQINLIKWKLILFKKQLQNGDPTHFSSFFQTDENAQFCKEEIKVYEEMERRFSEFNDLDFSEKLFRNPFDTDTSDFSLKEGDVRAKLQTELLTSMRHGSTEQSPQKGSQW